VEGAGPRSFLGGLATVARAIRGILLTNAMALAACAGHHQIQNTLRYVRLSPERFKGFRWND
jgi:hypothetical protein